MAVQESVHQKSAPDSKRLVTKAVDVVSLELSVTSNTSQKKSNLLSRGSGAEILRGSLWASR